MHVRPGDEALELVDAVQRLSLARTPEEVQAIVRTTARKLCGADGATLVLRDGDDCRYVDEDAIAPLWKGKRFPMSACVSGWAMQHREAVAIEDIYSDDRIPADAYRPTFVKSLAMVPVRRRDPIGAIGNYWAERHAPSEREVQLLQALADSAAVAMENVGLWAELEDRVAERTANLESSIQLNERLLGTLAHEVRNTTAVSEGLLSIVLRSEETEMDARTRELVEHARRASADGSRIMDEQLLAAKDRAGELRPRFAPVEIAPMLEELRDVYTALHNGSGVRVVVMPGNHPEAISTDALLLSQALRNLVSNALKFTPHGLVALQARTVESGMVEFSVADSGPGVPEEQRERIFDDWAQSSDGDHAMWGSGLGLPFVRRFAEVLGGTAALESNAVGGSTFTITIPDRERVQDDHRAVPDPQRRADPDHHA